MCLPVTQAICGQAENRQIVALGGSAGEYHLAPAGPDHLRDAVASLFYGAPGAKAIVVRPAAGVPEFLGKVSKNFCLHARIDGRRRGTIKVDRALSSVQHAAHRSLSR